MRFGSDEIEFEIEIDWAKLPEGWSFGHVIGVDVDQNDNVYVLNRGEHPLIIFDKDGKFLKSWGEGEMTAGHGLHIEGKVAYITDYKEHIVSKYTLDGRLLKTWGTRGVPGEDGEPFNRPTDVDVAPSGEIYISDGYVNARVHKYSADGELLFSWGEHGTGPGQFDISHDVCIARDGRVFVADRQNHRIQIFTPHGEYINELTGFKQPCSVTIDKDDYIYVTELQQRFSILDSEGNLIARWGGEKSLEPGLFMNPHCACIDSKGDLYIGETLEGSRIQKFKRVR
jgi:DNA-binding beta-propeller fold protein YncE